MHIIANDHMIIAPAVSSGHAPFGSAAPAAPPRDVARQRSDTPKPANAPVPTSGSDVDALVRL
jgi:hypothetical protein